MGDGHGWFNFGGGFMWIFWIIIIVAIIALVKGLSGSSSNSSSASPMEILRKRYANGEISDEEFEHRRKQLEK